MAAHAPGPVSKQPPHVRVPDPFQLAELKSVNKEEAHQVLTLELDAFRSKSYEELSSLVGSVAAFTRKGPSGAEYQLEIEVMWDNPRSKQRNLRVIASIDDGGFTTSFIPLTSDFIKSPGGPFVGE